MTKEEAAEKVKATLAEAKEKLSAEDYQSVVDSTFELISGNEKAADTSEAAGG